MKIQFYHKGKKAPSAGYDIASGCLILIGFGGIIFAFTSIISSSEDLEDYWIELLFGLIVGISFLFQLFRKKGKLFTYKIELSEHELKMLDISAKCKQLQLDIYTNENEEFVFYHLWDFLGNVALFSLYKDDLCDYLSEKYPTKTTYYKITNCSFASYENYIISDTRKVTYNLETGHFKISNKTGVIADITPKAYAFDGKYKKGIGLSRRK